MGKKRPVPIAECHPGIFCDSSLWLDEDFILLTKETPISESLIEDLKRWNFDTVFTEGFFVGTGTIQGTEGEGQINATLNNDAEENEGRREARQFFENLSTFTRKIYEVFDREGTLDMQAITEQVKGCISMIKMHRIFILRLPDLRSEGIDYLYTHSARSTILSLTIGDAMKLPNHKLIELGISALLHEVGMMRIPKQIYHKTTSLSEMEKKLVNTHPLVGLRMIRDYSKSNALPLPQDILMGIWQHHERANGSGYPQHLKGDSISLFGKIIGAACSYDAQISRRPYRERADGHTSLIVMLKEMQDLYDEKVIRSLLLSLSIYPLGSYVQLDNGATGVVVDTNTGNPKFPIVKLLFDKNHNLFKEQSLIETKDQKGFSIAGVLSIQEIKDFQEKKLITT